MKSTSLAAALLASLATAKFTFYGSNESGAEFDATVPGIPDKDFTFPNV
jgi:hypothetical protein